MMYQLSNWWAFRVEEQGILDHSHRQMVVLRPPLNRVYEEVLSTFVAGWENGRPDKPRRSRDAQKVVFDQAQESRDRTSGVNLDEELSDLLRYQQAYQANAQVIQTASRLFDALMQRL